MKNLAVIILAAGNSSRLGKPKQLLNYQNSTLIKKVVEEASKIQDAEIIVVTGAEKTSLEEELKDLEINLTHNEKWETGMSSSLKAGLEKALRINPQLEAALFLVSDQPFVDADLLEKLIKNFDNNKEISASFYSETFGVPVIFGRQYFPELSGLSGKEGAKTLLKKHRGKISEVPFPKGEIDIDTPEDYDKLLSFLEVSK